MAKPYDEGTYIGMLKHNINTTGGCFEMSTTAASALPLEIHDLTDRLPQEGGALRRRSEVPTGAARGNHRPNGAGKSTLIKAIMGVVPASSGWIKIFGEPFRRTSPASATCRSGSPWTGISGERDGCGADGPLPGI
jgi:ABC-type protease/lipase transport system fused ATPase/permease subunit